MTTLKKIINFLDNDFLESEINYYYENVISGIENVENFESINVKNALISAVSNTTILTKAITLDANLIITVDSFYNKNIRKSSNIMFKSILRSIKLISTGRITIYTLGKKWFYIPYGANYMIADKISGAKVHNEILKHRDKHILITLAEFDEKTVRGIVKETATKLGCKQISVFGDIKKKINNAVIMAGIFRKAKIHDLDVIISKSKVNIDALIVGEITYDTALYLVDNNLVVIEVGYTESLLPALNYLKNILQIKFRDVNFIINKEYPRELINFY